jgi:hypothetical protein
VPTLVNVIIVVAVFTYMGWAGLLEGRGLLWPLVWPLLLFLNAPLHEASHALAGRLQGLSVLEFQAWRWSGNYVRFDGDVTWLVLLAPYLRDLVAFALTALLLARLSPRRRGVWLGLFLTGMLLSLWNTCLEYVGVFVGRSSDVGRLLAMLPPAAVLLGLGTALLGYLLVIALTLRRAARQLQAGEA